MINYLEPDRDLIKPSPTQQMTQVKSRGQDHAPQVWHGL